MNTQEEVTAYYAELETMKQRIPTSAQEMAFGRTLRQDDEYATARISEADALEMLERHGVQSQVLNDKIQALSVWTDKHAGGGIGSEWVDVVCRRDWLRAFLGN